MADTDNDSRFPAGMTVATPYPLTEEEKNGDRAARPWLTGQVLEQVGADQWQIAVRAREASQLEDGSPAPEDTDDDDLFHPLVFRDSSGIRPWP